MMYLKKVLVAITLLAVSNFSFGYDDKGSWTYVKKIYVPSNGGSPFVYFEANGLPGCYTDNAAYIPASSAEGANRLHSTLLAALMAKRKVQAFYNYTNSDQGSWGRCTLEAVYIQ